VVEKLAYLPESYMVNDHPSLHPEASSLRSLHEDRGRITGAFRPQFGLPADAFIFCNFNQMYKIEPKLFDAWLHILANTERTVLWILSFNDVVKPNLRQRAEAFGVDMSRIIFTDRVDEHAHVFMKSLADLHLDTSVFNAHSTALDHLWAAVPGLTLPHEAMAGRVGASLHSSLGCSHAVMRSLGEYVELAIRAARSPRVIGRLRQSVMEGRSTAPLFKVERWVGHFERLSRLIYETSYWAGRPFHVAMTHVLPGAGSIRRGP
jgi:protein O-GlcNAc transferase